MPRSLIQRRQEAERARVEAYDCSLRRVSQRGRPAPDFQTAIAEAQRGFEADVLRDPRAWKPQMKTRDGARLRLAAARHLFARYPVGAHLEQIWIDSAGLDSQEIALRKRWYIVAASGASLYRAGASQWLARKEVHAFLNPPGNLGFDEAIWLAIARSYAHDVGLALRISHSSLARTPRAELGFWREVARFFCVNPAPMEVMDDLRDYIADCRQRDPAFSLKGRTLASLARGMRAWHRDLEAIERIEAARRRAEAERNRGRAATPAAEAERNALPRASIASWSWRPSATGSKRPREEYEIVQLCTAADLVAETRAMRHCVSTYAAKCIAGNATIWSLRRHLGAASDRLLTIELDRQHRAIQIRGFANRPAHAEERKILERWAKARNIGLA